MSDDELEAIRDRIGDSQAQTGADVLTLLAEVFRLRDLVGEPEWEYGIEYSPNDWEFEGDSLEQIEKRVANIRSHPKGAYAQTAKAIRRRRAGDPEPVPETGDDQ